jgi:hypothetical protein
MLVNRDTRAHDTTLGFAGSHVRIHPDNTWDEVQYSSAQYAYPDRGEKSKPTKDDPPVRSKLKGNRVHLPAMSLTVVSYSGREG